MEWFDVAKTLVPFVAGFVVVPIANGVDRYVNKRKEKMEVLEKERKDKVIAEMSKRLVGMTPSECEHTRDVINGTMTIEDAASTCKAKMDLMFRVMNTMKENERKRMESDYTALNIKLPYRVLPRDCPAAFLMFSSGVIDSLQAVEACIKEQTRCGPK